MGGIAFCYEYRFASFFGNKGILSIAFALEGTYHFCAVIIQTELALLNFGDIIVIQKVM